MVVLKIGIWVKKCSNYLFIGRTSLIFNVKKEKLNGKTRQKEKQKKT